jgi:hypothetical protein
MDVSNIIFFCLFHAHSAIALVGCKGFVAEILNCDCHVLPLPFFTVLQVC